MLTTGRRRYPLCLLDTMAVSEMVKDHQVLCRFFEWAGAVDPMFVPCFTTYTILELRRRPELFRQFVDELQLFPSVLIKGYAELLSDEVATYPDPTRTDPCSIAFTPFDRESAQLSNLPQLLDVFADQEDRWNKARPDIVKGMVSLVPNYPPSRKWYTDAEVRDFVWIASFEQLVHHHADFVKSRVDCDEAIDICAFPTLKAMTYTVFHKFYSDRDRRPSNSVAFDLLISAALPYVEAVVTENHQAEALRKTKKRDNFLGELEVLTLRDFRQRVPSAGAKT